MPFRPTSPVADTRASRRIRRSASTAGGQGDLPDSAAVQVRQAGPSRAVPLLVEAQDESPATIGQEQRRAGTTRHDALEIGAGAGPDARVFGRPDVGATRAAGLLHHPAARIGGRREPHLGMVDAKPIEQGKEPHGVPNGGDDFGGIAEEAPPRSQPGQQCDATLETGAVDQARRMARRGEFRGGGQQAAAIEAEPVRGHDGPAGRRDGAGVSIGEVVENHHPMAAAGGRRGERAAGHARHEHRCRVSPHREM